MFGMGLASEPSVLCPVIWGCIILSHFFIRSPSSCTRSCPEFWNFVFKPTSAAASITIIISNKIALFNNSSSRIYPFIYYQHADHISISFLARVLDDPFQSGSHPLFLQRVRRVIWASLLSVNVMRTTPRTSATTPWAVRTTSSLHARRVNAHARNTPRVSSGPGARARPQGGARAISRLPETMWPRVWIVTCLVPSTVNCRKPKVIIVSCRVAGQWSGLLNDCMTSLNSDILDQARLLL